MTKRPSEGHSNDSTPWRGDSRTAPPEKLLAGHQVETLDGAYRCCGCAFKSQDIGEAVGHLIRSQFAVAGASNPAPAADPADDGGAA